jgi:5'-3' exonuclease
MGTGLHVHLVDGTYELFRHHFGAPPASDVGGRPVGAVRGVLASVLLMIDHGATHLAVATDHVIESFRNGMYPGYKTGEGIEPDLLAQFHPLEDALRAMGVTVWPMKEFEADDGLASGAFLADADPRVERVVICTPDKDLAQCVRDDRVVQLDRRAGTVRDAAGVREKFGVEPTSIPDWLALVGDSADGFPGVSGWGAKSSSTVLARYPHLEDIPADSAGWDVKVRGAARLEESLRAAWKDALLFRDLATLRTGVEVFGDVDELRWAGPAPGFAAFCRDLGDEGLAERAARLAADRG